MRQWKSSSQRNASTANRSSAVRYASSMVESGSSDWACKNAGSASNSDIAGRSHRSWTNGVPIVAANHLIVRRPGLYIMPPNGGYGGMLFSCPAYHHPR